MSDYKRLLADHDFIEFVATIIEKTGKALALEVKQKPEDSLPELMSLRQTRKFLHLKDGIPKALRSGDLWTVTVQGKPKFRKADLLLFNLHGTARVNGNKPPVTRKSAVPSINP